MKLKIYRNESPDTAFDYCYIIIGSFYNKQHSVEIHDNSIVIKDFENFVYWFEQQIYYLTYEQFKKIDGIWLRMMVKHFEKRDELAF